MEQMYVFATFGYPGSGKTYFAEHLAQKLGYFHLSSDRIRLKMFSAPTYQPPEHRLLFRFMDYLAEEFLRHGVGVVYDANFNRRIQRVFLKRLAERNGATFRLIWIQTSEELAKQRLMEQRTRVIGVKKREIYRPITLEIFEAIRSRMEYPEEDEEVIIIDGHLPFEDQFEEFRRQLAFTLG